MDRTPAPAAVRQRLFALADQKNRQGPKTTVDSLAVARYGAMVGRDIRCYSRLTRAMEQARQLIDSEAEAGGAVASGTVLLAGQLAGARGRFRRQWHAPSGGLWGCLILAATLLPPSRALIPYAVGVAGCEAVRQAGAARTQLRWVNDLLWAGGKLAGFLVEGYREPHHGEEFDLVGFGINVNNRHFPGELAGSAVALAQAVGGDLCLADFAETFLACLAWNVGLLYHEEAREAREAWQLSGEGFAGPVGGHALLARWRELSDTIGRRVVYGLDVLQAPQYEATVVGLEVDGGLLLRLADGAVTSQYCGELRYLPDQHR